MKKHYKWQEYRDNISVKYTKEYQSWTSKQKKQWGHYLAGFWEGEGSMSISITKRNHQKFGIQLLPKVSIGQDQDALFILDWIQLYFGGYGSLGNRKKKPSFWTYHLQSRASIQKYFIPFYENYLFKRSGKRETFRIFKEILNWLL